jgi:hypothetical protein
MDIPQAAKAYENHCAKNGKPTSHEKAKELLYVLFCVWLGDMYSPPIQCRILWCSRRQARRDKGRK